MVISPPGRSIRSLVLRAVRDDGRPLGPAAAPGGVQPRAGPTDANGGTTNFVADDTAIQTS
jgi:hypothetical protein